MIREDSHHYLIIITISIIWLGHKTLIDIRVQTIEPEKAVDTFEWETTKFSEHS